MATKRKAAIKVQIFPSSILPKGHKTIQYGEHIIGVIHEGSRGVSVKRIKLDRLDDGRGVYVEPTGTLAKPFETTTAAADACLDEWLGRAA